MLMPERSDMLASERPAAGPRDGTLRLGDEIYDFRGSPNGRYRLAWAEFTWVRRAGESEPREGPGRYRLLLGDRVVAGGTLDSLNGAEVADNGTFVLTSRPLGRDAEPCHLYALDDAGRVLLEEELEGRPRASAISDDGRLGVIAVAGPPGTPSRTHLIVAYDLSEAERRGPKRSHSS